MNLFVFLALILLFYPTANPVLAQEKLLRTLTVTGQGVERIPTTLTNVSLGVSVQGQTAFGVQQEAARRSSAVVTYLKSHQVERLETTLISLNPIDSDNNSVQHLTGYSATNTVSFRVDTKQAGTVLDEAVKAGATRIDSVSFVASDSATAQAQQQALQKATQDAQRQADAVLGSLHLTRREVVSIQVNGASPPQPLVRQYEARANAVNKAAPTPVIGGEQQVDAAVTLQITY
jgi:uncharacterized protein YggE